MLSTSVHFGLPLPFVEEDTQLSFAHIHYSLGGSGSVGDFVQLLHTMDLESQ